MNPDVKETLERALELSQEMIDLAKTGIQADANVECGIVFGTLRDCGYQVRKLAERELGKSWAQVASKQEGALAEVVQIRTPGKKVLIVDDNADVVTYLSRWFEDRGFQAVTANDGVEAMERIVEEQVDLITLDMSMPEKSGVKVFQQLKQSEKYQQIPVLIITGIGNPMKKFLDKTKQVPKPDGFVAKPIDLHDLATQVRNLVGGM